MVCRKSGTDLNGGSGEDLVYINNIGIRLVGWYANIASYPFVQDGEV